VKRHALGSWRSEVRGLRRLPPTSNLKLPAVTVSRFTRGMIQAISLWTVMNNSRCLTPIVRRCRVTLAVPAGVTSQCQVGWCYWDCRSEGVSVENLPGLNYREPSGRLPREEKPAQPASSRLFAEPASKGKTTGVEAGLLKGSASRPEPDEFADDGSGCAGHAHRRLLLRPGLRGTGPTSAIG
jgi:hypothetical protein